MTAGSGFELLDGGCASAGTGTFVSFINGTSDTTIPKFMCVRDTTTGELIEVQNILFDAIPSPSSDGRNMTYDVIGSGSFCCVDNDGDGFGANGTDTSGCPLVGEDCNDNDEFINPDALEICNLIDDNCNVLIDENDQVPPTTVLVKE